MFKCSILYVLIFTLWGCNGLIYPGTKWCGVGNVAKNYDDLGSSFETDMCCRDHDHCDDIIEAGKKKYNLYNDSIFTKSNCKCDEKFYNCLKGITKKTARHVGKLYFDLLCTKCYRQANPGVRCAEWDRINRFLCTKFEKVYEWAKQPKFYKLIFN